MKTIILNVHDILNSPSAITREQGEILYKKIVDIIQTGDQAILDFANIESMISAFLNVAVGQLYRYYSSDKLQQHLSFLNVTNEQIGLFNVVIQNAKRFYSNPDQYQKAEKDVYEQ